MIDAHCHLYEAEDVEAELARFRAAGGEALVCAGAGVESSGVAAGLAEKYDGVWATAGVHPENFEEIKGLSDEEIKKKLIELTRHKKVVAVGECGLDYPDGSPPRESPFGHSRGESRERQRELFKKNVGAARETKLPLVVHCRNAFGEVWKLVKDTGVVGQMHCWTGSEEWMRKFVETGWYISFGGIVTFKNSRDLREVAKIVPEERLLVETDSPYLAPEPVRGSKNEPANVKYVVACLAEVRGMNEEKMGRITSENARRVFGLTV